MNDTAASARALSGKIVRLAPFLEAHITADYLGWLNDRRLMRFSRQRHFTHTRQSCSDYLASFKNAAHFFWAVEFAADGLLVGTMTMFVDAQNKTADMGILIGHKQASGRGCGTEAWGLALRHGFENLGLRKITGGAAAENRAMLRIFEHWKMTLEGAQRKQELLDDGPADVLLYGLLREEWRIC